MRPVTEAVAEADEAAEAPGVPEAPEAEEAGEDGFADEVPLDGQSGVVSTSMLFSLHRLTAKSMVFWISD